MKIKNLLKKKSFWAALSGVVVIVLQFFDIKIEVPLVNEILVGLSSLLIAGGVICASDTDSSKQQDGKIDEAQSSQSNVDEAKLSDKNTDTASLSKNKTDVNSVNSSVNNSDNSDKTVSKSDDVEVKAKDSADSE